MRGVFGVLFLFFSSAVYADTLPVEAFGAQPYLYDVAISPDGKHTAMILREGEVSVVVAQNLETKEMIPLAHAGKGKPRRVGWADNDTVLFWTSRAARNFQFRSSLIEFGAVFSVGLNGKEPRQLMRRGSEIAVNTSTFNVTSLKVDDPNHVQMAAFGTSRSGDARAGRVYSLFDVNLETGVAKLTKRGSPSTIFFIVDEKGDVFARIDHRQKGDDWRIYSYVSGKAVKIFEDVDAPLAPYSVWGLTPDKKSLIVSDAVGNTDVVYKMSLETGELGSPVFSEPNSSLVFDIEDESSSIIRALAYFDIEKPKYRFFDETLSAVFQEIDQLLEGAPARIVSASDNYRQLVLYVEGNFTAGAYIVFDRNIGKIIAFYEARPDIPKESIAEVLKVEYPVRDGLQIQGLLTKAAGVELKNLPTIVMPHGGPAAADRVGWDWMAQYFANKGYAVFQPNFRGSSGYGTDFEIAGYGEWGRGAMQHDITDGLQALIKSGMTDPDRVCIVGASYGGYAALAGATFTPDLYKCAVAIAPVADLNRMLIDERRSMGGDSWVVSYWRKLIEGSDSETLLREISPARHVDQVTAPILLLHGDDDIVVPIAQSRIMNNALKRAGKDVSFTVLKDEDHWLSKTPTRVQTLREVGQFIDKHIGE